jgi:ABC-2 type transport system ATP-binding protein
MSHDIDLKVVDLTVRYGRREVLQRVSLSVPRGSVYAILGRNGAGKSSLIRCVCGFQRPAAGRVELLGRDSWIERRELMQEVGIVPEDTDAPPEMRVGDLLTFYRRSYRRWDAAETAARLERLRIPLDRRFATLSKGERRQVMLAAVLGTLPRLLILDDPTLGLDAVARKELFEELVGDLADRGITVILTTHDLAGVEAIADRVAILSGGRVVLEEEVEALRSRFRRIRFSSEPADDATLLARLQTLRVRRWGNALEAVVSRYDERIETTAVTEVVPMNLEEIFVAVAESQAGGAE